MADPPATVVLLPFRIGDYPLALEAARVVQVLRTSLADVPEDERSPVIRVDLHMLLEAPAVDGGETVLARTDRSIGRGQGTRVAFEVDRAERLVPVPLESFAPLPPVAREQLQVDFLVGIVRLPLRGPSWQASDGRDLAYLLDPARLARAAGG